MADHTPGSKENVLNAIDLAILWCDIAGRSGLKDHRETFVQACRVAIDTGAIDRAAPGIVLYLIDAAAIYPDLEGARALLPMAREWAEEAGHG